MFMPIILGLSFAAAIVQAADPERLLASARAKLGQGQVVAAKAELNSIVAGESEALTAAVRVEAWVLLGKVASAEGDPALAKDCYSKSIELVEKFSLPDSGIFLQSLNYRADLFRREGAFASASADCQRALKAIDSIYGEGPEQRSFPAKAAVYNTLGMLAHSQAKFTAAREWFEAALDMRMQLKLSEHPGTGALHTNLALLHESMGEFSSARKHAERALEISTPDNSMLAILHHNLGGILESEGESILARIECLKALELLKKAFPDKLHPRVATVFVTLGMLEFELGNAEPSIEYLREALQIREVLYGEGANAEIASVKAYLGRSFLLAGDLSQAEMLSSEAIEEIAEIFPNAPPHPLRCKWELQQAKIKSAQGVRDQALALATSAAEMYASAFPAELFPDGHLDQADALETLGGFQFQNHQYAAAIKNLIASSKMRTSLAEGFSFTAAEAEARQFLNSHLNSPTLLLEAMQLESWDAEKQYGTILSSRRMLPRIIAARNELLHSRLSQTPALEDYISIRKELNFAQKLDVEALGDVAEQRQRLRDLTAEKEVLERQLADELTTYSTTAFVSVTARDIMKSLSEEQSLVEILRLDEKESIAAKYVAFVITRSAVSRVELGPAESVEAAARSWLGTLRNARDADGEWLAARAFSNDVWKPLSAAIDDHIKRLYVCPDGLPAQIPWAALLDQNSDERLVERYVISLLPYSQVLAAAQRSPHIDPDRCLLVGDVDYKNSGWSPLPGTAKELDRLAIAFKPVSRNLVSVRGSNANVSEVCDQLGQATIAHIASHGKFEEPPAQNVETSTKVEAEQVRNPLLQSSLVLANLDDAAVRGSQLLTGEQIASMDLRSLSLITLSACDSGRGTALAGEGVYGLQQAFFIAGARSIVATQWQIDDAQTVELMTQFYHQLLTSDMTIAEALATSQRAATAAGSSVTEEDTRGVKRVSDDKADTTKTLARTASLHPYFWASFQHCGL